MVEVACECDDGRGCAHSHWTTTTVRRDNGHTFDVHGTFLEQPGYTIVRTEHGIRYWGDTIIVDTDDLETLVKKADAYGAAREAQQRLRRAVAHHRDVFPVPPKRDRL